MQNNIYITKQYHKNAEESLFISADLPEIAEVDQNKLDEYLWNESGFSDTPSKVWCIEREALCAVFADFAGETPVSLNNLILGAATFIGVTDATEEVLARIADTELV